MTQSSVLSSILALVRNSHVVLRPDFWREQLERAQAALLGGLAQAVVIAVLFLVARAIAFRIVDGLLVPVLSRESERLEASAARVRTLQGLLKSVIGYALIFMAVVALLQGFGIGISGIIASAGVLGLAVGFGAQKLVRDVISGFFMLLENQYAVGDYVTIGAISGEVEYMGMRTTHIRDDYGRICIISNGDISQVINHSRGPAVAVVEVGVPAGTDPKALEAVLKRVGDELTGKGKPLESAPELEGLVSADAAKFVIRVKAISAPGRRIPAEMALREALVRGLREAGIGVL